MIAVNDVNRYELHFRQFMLINTHWQLWCSKLELFPKFIKKMSYDGEIAKFLLSIFKIW